VFDWIKDKVSDAVFEAKWKAEKIGSKVSDAKETIRRESEDWSEILDDIKHIPSDAWNEGQIEEELGELHPKFDPIYKAIIFCHLQDFNEVSIKIGNGSAQRNLNVRVGALKKALQITRTCSLHITTTRDGGNWDLGIEIKPVSNSKKMALLKLAFDHNWVSSDVFDALTEAYNYRIKSEKVSTVDVAKYAEYLQKGVIADNTIKLLTSELVSSHVSIS